MAHRQKKVLAKKSPHFGEPVEREHEHNIVSTTSLVHVDLKKEYIRFCKLYASEPLDIVATPLSKASYEQDSLTVDLKGRGLRGVDCIALGKIFATDIPITHLNLSDCLLMPQGFQALLDGICKNSKLKVLELRGNSIQANMVVALGKLLKQNSGLTQLVLEWNCLGESKECFRIFSEGLSINVGLEILDLRNNQIDATSATELASALKHNKTLREIDLRWNSVGLVGAKAIWDSLRTNVTLSKIALTGNYIPEDIVAYIENCLSERRERDALMEETSKRSSVLAQKLVTKEEEYERELESMVSIFNEEETTFKNIIQRDRAKISSLNAEILDKTRDNEDLLQQLNDLKLSLKNARESEETFRRGINLKEMESKDKEQVHKLEMCSTRQSYERKMDMLNNDTEQKMKELQIMMVKVKDLEIQLSDKVVMIEHLNDIVEKMKINSQKSENFFEERIQLEKERWANWKNEVETAERGEIAMLENQIKEIQDSMMDHIRMVEKGKTEAEEEIRSLKMNLLAVRSEAEENLSQLRKSLKDEYDSLVDGYSSQISTLKDNNDTLELELKKRESQLRNLGIEKANLSREADSLRIQNARISEELYEKDSTNQSVLIRAQNDSKERMEQLKKEQETNEALRVEILGLQEQLATLTIKHTRDSQGKFSEMQKWKLQIERTNCELARFKEDDVKRAVLLQDAFLAYMHSTSLATGIPLVPLSTFSPETGDQPKTETDMKIH